MSSSSIPPNVSYAELSVRAVLYISIVTIWVLTSASTSAAESQAKTQQQRNEVTIQSTSRKGSLVRGRVIYEDTRRPLRRVEVTIYDPANRSRGRHLVAWTDGRGEFQIKDVPKGKYFVTVSATGIIRSGPFDSEASRKDLTSVIVDGTTQSEVVVRVKRGGAIAGKVTYPDGDPVLNASIRLFRRKDGKWTSIYVGGPSTDRVLTDERGVYRVSGLPPGEYLVGAAEEKMGIELTAQDDPDGGNMLNRALLPTTYYGGAISLSGATVLQVEASDEETDINITLADLPIHSISGVVTLKGDNRPVIRARISLKKKDEELDSPSYSEDLVVNTDEQGRFIFDEVPEGSYTMTITSPRVYPGRYGDGQPALQAYTDPTQKFAAKHLELSIAGTDLSNLLIEVSSGGHISGVVRVDGTKPLPRNVFVFLVPAGGERPDQLSAPMQADGTFTLEGIPSGDYYLRTAVQPNNDYYTKSVTQGRSDLTFELLSVKEGEDISNVRLVISPDVARLSARVLSSDGKSPERGVGILLIPADPVEQKTMSRRMYGFTNADGVFRVSGAPGEYLAIVMRQGENFYQLIGDKLDSHTAKAQRIMLQPGENNRIELIFAGER